ncbi:hypothetical protein EKG40_08045 [Pseudomonas moorei]|nr:hypothetical protein EKG40_08045 [Pseudomonas moorei]
MFMRFINSIAFSKVKFFGAIALIFFNVQIAKGAEQVIEPYKVVATVDAPIFNGISTENDDDPMSLLAMSLILKVQESLRSRGYEVGPLDGKLGEHTEEAIYLFQMDRNIDVTGSINVPTLTLLNIDPPAWFVARY